MASGIPKQSEPRSLGSNKSRPQWIVIRMHGWLYSKSLEFFSTAMSIILAEDKNYYADPSELYRNAETVFQPEDTQPIHVPIVATKRYVPHILFSIFIIES
jgi:hypothetical protein